MFDTVPRPLRLKNDAGEELDATCTLEDDAHARPTLVVHSAGGSNRRKGTIARNPDYSRAMELVLQRLAARRILILDAVVDSQPASSLPYEQHQIRIPQRPYPWSLAAVDVHELRLEIGRAVAAIGRPEAARPSSGNRQKQVRLWLGERVSPHELENPVPGHDG